MNTDRPAITLTQQELDEILNAVRYTQATINNRFSTGKRDWAAIHIDRAHQSCAYLNDVESLLTDKFRSQAEWGSK